MFQNKYALLIAICSGLFIYFFYEIVLILLFSLVMAISINPLVIWLENKKIPKPVTILLIFSLIVGAITLTGYKLLPTILDLLVFSQESLPTILGQAVDRLPLFQGTSANSQTASIVNSISDYFVNNLTNLVERTIEVLFSVGGWLFSLVTGVAITTYLTIDLTQIEKWFIDRWPPDRQTKVRGTILKIKAGVGSWLRGQIFASVFVGLLTYLGLSILGIQFALLLAIMTALLDIVPLIGSTLSGVIAALVALLSSPGQAIWVILLYVLVQQIEGNLLIPRIMNRAVGLHPVVVIVSIMIAGQAFGLLGALLAIPVMSSLWIVYQEVIEPKIKRRV